MKWLYKYLFESLLSVLWVYTNMFNCRLIWLFYFQFLKIFIYLFWLCWVFVAVHGLSLVAAPGLLIAVASLVAEHRL